MSNSPFLAPHHVAVLKGGPGSEREVSLRSGTAVARALAEAGAGRVSEVDVTGEDFDLPAGTTLAFNIIHGTFGEDGRVQEILDARGVPYTGEGAAGSRLAIDKIATKQRFQAANVPTPPAEVLAPGERPTMELPYVVKAPREGSSVGVYLCRMAAEVDAALRDVRAFETGQILVEKLIDGEELTVGVVGDQALPVIMIRPKNGFYDYKNKYPWSNPDGAADHFCPAPLPPELTARLQRLALEAHRALGLEIYSRVDFLLSRLDDEPFALEINTIPGMTDSSLLPEAARAAGIEFPQLCERIARLSLARHERLAR